MADDPISALPAGGALAGTEEFAAVQSAATKKLTGDQIAAYHDVRNLIAVELTHSVDQSISDTTWTTLAFDTEGYDPAGLHAPGDNTKITVTVAGVYIVTYSGRFASNVTGRRGARLLNNGGIIAEALRAVSTGSQTPVEISWVGNLAASDVLTIDVFQSSTGALNLESARLYFNAALVVRI